MRHASLTKREAEVLEFVARGRTSKEIAAALRLSVHTVNNHRKRVCRKLNLHSTAELVAFAARHCATDETPAGETPAGPELQPIA
jgi:DNA-binding CsgD family transcriptional regulator